jgi:hypothetical protein
VARGAEPRDEPRTEESESGEAKRPPPAAPARLEIAAPGPSLAGPATRSLCCRQSDPPGPSPRLSPERAAAWRGTRARGWHTAGSLQISVFLPRVAPWGELESRGVNASEKSRIPPSSASARRSPSTRRWLDTTSAARSPTRGC